MRVSLGAVELQRERAKDAEARLAKARLEFQTAEHHLTTAERDAEHDRQALAELEQLWDAERAERTAHITVSDTGWKASA